MKGQDLIDLIKKHQLENVDMCFSLKIEDERDEDGINGSITDIAEVSGPVKMLCGESPKGLINIIFKSTYEDDE